MVNLGDILNIEKLESLISEGYISRKFHNEYKNLAVLNYTPMAQYDPKLVWGEEMAWCRGLIYNTDTMEVVARPFAKFWNFSDTRHPETMPENLPNEVPLFLEKLDGSLGVLFEWGGMNFVATRGSFHSEQAEWATNWLRVRYPRLVLPKDMTILTEVIYKENKIVVDYDFEGLVVLGAVNKSTGVEAHRDDIKGYCRAMGLSLVKEYKKTLDEALTEDERNREGYVLTFPSTGLKIKVKYNSYCQLHRILTGLNIRSVWELMRDGEYATIEGWLSDPLIPASFKSWVRGVFDDFIGKYRTVLEETLRIFTAMPATETRKEVAQYFLLPENKKYSGMLFGLFDGKKIDQSIWKMIEPSGNAVFRVEGE